MVNDTVKSTATQLAVIDQSAVVGITQTILQASVVTNGQVKNASIQNKTVMKKGKVVNTTSVSLSF